MCRVAEAISTEMTDTAVLNIEGSQQLAVDTYIPGVDKQQRERGETTLVFPALPANAAASTHI